MKVEKICSICGKTYFVYRYWADVSKCCSKKCFSQWQSIHYTPPHKREVKEFNCILCGKSFSSLLSTPLFCSRDCYHEYKKQEYQRNHKDELVKVCEYCKNTFMVRNLYLKEKRRFCSRKCKIESQKNKITVVCQECGKGFEAIPYNVKNGYAKYCSRPCKDKALSKRFAGNKNHLWKGAKVKRNCQRCGTEFETFESNIKRGNGRFCSARCQYDWMSESLQGENGINWQGGKSFLPYPPEFNKTLKRAIRKRDKQACALCRNRGRTIHHIDYNKNNNDPENLITLCNKCHGKVGGKRKQSYWIEFFTKMRESKCQETI